MPDSRPEPEYAQTNHAPPGRSGPPEQDAQSRNFDAQDYEAQNFDILRLSRLPSLDGGATLAPPDVSEPKSLSALPGATLAPRDKKRFEAEPKSYYDVPMLKPPVWKWEIAAYFFLGGVSGGAYSVARMAARFGGGEYQDITQAGTLIAALAFAPCAPLLIVDLGDKKRFIYMLRVFKPKSPMNLGSWVLTGFGGFVTLAALNEGRLAWAAQNAGKEGRLGSGSGAEKAAGGTALDAVINALLDGGVPFALLLAGYTGVLLSTSATPLWARKKWLGALFSASAVSTGVSAIELALQIKSPDADAQPSHAALKTIEMAAKAVEAVTLAGYLAETGKLAAPITTGKYAPHLWGGAVGAGLVGSALLGAIPAQDPRTRRVLRIAGAIAGLAGGFALRWAISQGGHISGKDPQAARDSSKPNAK